MKPFPPPERRRVARAASAMRIPRGTARALLKSPTPLVRDLLAEVVRIGPGAVLAYARTQPDVASK